jgi:hypothetical protein
MFSDEIKSKYLAVNSSALCAISTPTAQHKTAILQWLARISLMEIMWNLQSKSGTEVYFCVLPLPVTVPPEFLTHLSSGDDTMEPAVAAVSSTIYSQM